MKSKDIIRKLKNKYSLEKSHRESEALQNFYNALKIKEFKDIHIEIKKLEILISKGDAAKSIIEKNKTTLRQLYKDRLNILKKYSISPDSFIPKYSCKNCQDSGFKDGKICECLKKDWLLESMEQSNVDLSNISRLTDYNTSLFGNDAKPYMNRLKKYFTNYLSSFPNNQIYNIVLSGNTGSGKTYLAKILAKEVIIKGFSAYYTSSFNMVNSMLKYHTSFDKESGLLDSLLEPELLIIDDLGTEPIFNNITKEYFLSIIEERINSRKKTIFTTNLDTDGILARYQERIFSRITNKQNCILLRMQSEKDLRVKI